MDLIHICGKELHSGYVVTVNNAADLLLTIYRRYGSGGIGEAVIVHKGTYSGGHTDYSHSDHSDNCSGNCSDEHSDSPHSDITHSRTLKFTTEET